MNPAAAMNNPEQQSAESPVSSEQPAVGCGDLVLPGVGFFVPIEQVGNCVLRMLEPLLMPGCPSGLRRDGFEVFLGGKSFLFRAKQGVGGPYLEVFEGEVRDDGMPLIHGGDDPALVVYDPKLRAFKPAGSGDHA